MLESAILACAANVNHMQPEHLQKEALLQSLPASRQNVLRKRCTNRLIHYQELKALVKTQVDGALANYGASKNWEVPLPFFYPTFFITGRLRVVCAVDARWEGSVFGPHQLRQVRWPPPGATRLG